MKGDTHVSLSFPANMGGHRIPPARLKIFPAFIGVGVGIGIGVEREISGKMGVQSKSGVRPCIITSCRRMY